MSNKFTDNNSEINLHLSPYAHIIEGLLELATPEDGLPNDHNAIEADDILNTTSSRINKLIPLEAHAFFLVDDKLDFGLQTVTPHTTKTQFRRLADQWIEDGIFSWALNQNRAVVLDNEDGKKHILHVVATRDKVIGMYVGIVGAKQILDEGSLVLLSVILINCANNIENHQLHCELKHYTNNLETLVKERTRQLEIAKNNAENAAKEKTAFLATMSHEIRTPMNGVIGMAQMLQKTPLNDTQKEYSRIITQSGQALVYLIDDILDFSKIEAGKLQLHTHPTDIVALCSDVVALLKPQADSKGIKLEFPPPTSDIFKLIADSHRLRQILINLIGNAIKFTLQGEVTLTIKFASPQAGQTKILLSVKDTGTGISPEKQTLLFHPFHQAHHYQQDTQKSTGLGLSICKHLIEMMGGDIGLLSEPGQGSTFWLSAAFDIAAEDTTSRTIFNHHPQKNVDFTLFQGKILIAEDNPINQKVIQFMLQSLGLKNKIACNGQETLSALKQSKYDLIFMDCQMPIMDGYEATQRIRNDDGNKNQRTPIIALTANVLDDDRKHCHDVGMDDFLSKPINQRELQKCLSKWLNIEINNTNKKQLNNTNNVNQSNMVNTQVLSQLKELAAEQFDTLVSSFLEHTQKRLIDFQQALDSENIADAHFLLHTIKGGSATFGAHKLHELATQMDALAKDCELQQLQQLAEQFGQIFFTTRSEIQTFLDETN